MSLLMRHPSVVWLSIVVLIGHVGCAHIPPSDVPPPPEHMRARLGTIGVVSGRFTPESPDLPSYYQSGRRASGGGGGAWSGFYIPYTGGDGGGTAGLVLLAILVVAVTVALVIMLTEDDQDLGSTSPRTLRTWDRPGDVRALTKEELARLEVIHHALRERVLRAAEDRTSHHLVPLRDPAPTQPYERVNYESLGEKGIDTVLEISVPKLGLMEFSDHLGRPDAMLVMSALARLIRVEDGEELYARTWEYGGASHTPTQWAANNAKLLREELDGALQTLAEWIANELFLNQ